MALNENKHLHISIDSEQSSTSSTWFPLKVRKSQAVIGEEDEDTLLLSFQTCLSLQNTIESLSKQNKQYHLKLCLLQFSQVFPSFVFRTAVRGLYLNYSDEANWNEPCP